MRRYACDAGGCSPASNQVTVAVHRIPDPPTVTAPAVATANKTFVVSWTASTEATSYTLQQTEFGSRNAVKALYSG